jgi:aromatic ring-opening dioxygenase catalytic subunit (LigB family)
VVVTSSAQPPMLYDYGGFPPETYKYQYNAPGDPALAVRIRDLLQVNGIPAVLDDKRGYDHGVFVPLMLMFPQAAIPVVVVSLHASLQGAVHHDMGAALGSLRDEGVLLLGSGYTFHNMGAFFNPDPRFKRAAREFDAWLQDAMSQSDAGSRKASAENWEAAPGARLCHPR